MVCSLVSMIFFAFLRDGVVDLEVVILSITRGGDAVEHGQVTSFTIEHEEIAIEESPIAIHLDVLLSHSSLRWAKDGGS